MRYTERERNKREQNFNGARARCVYGKYNFLVSNDNRKRIYQALASKRRNTMQEKMKENSSIELDIKFPSNLCSMRKWIIDFFLSLSMLSAGFLRLLHSKEKNMLNRRFLIRFFFSFQVDDWNFIDV